MHVAPEAAPTLPSSRQEQLLEAAAEVFARYGFRKASMEDVARHAGISRPGLYLQFGSKEELFRRALEHSFERRLQEVQNALHRGGASLERRLVAACEAWAGRFDTFGAHASDLMCASSALAGSSLAAFEKQFMALLTRAIAECAGMHGALANGLEARDVARVLCAAARGFKQSCTSRAEFLTSLTAAARMVCAAIELSESI